MTFSAKVRIYTISVLLEVSSQKVVRCQMVFQCTKNYPFTNRLSCRTGFNLFRISQVLPVWDGF